MPTVSKEILKLLQLAKDLTFAFMRQMVTTAEAIDTASQAGTSSENVRHNSKQSADDFTRLQLQKTFMCFSQWLDSRSARTLQTAESIVEELEESHPRTVLRVWLIFVLHLLFI